MIMQHDLGLWFSLKEGDSSDQECAEEIMEAARTFATRLFNLVPGGAEQTIALSKLREVVYWSIEAVLTREGTKREHKDS